MQEPKITHEEPNIIRIEWEYENEDIHLDEDGTFQITATATVVTGGVRTATEIIETNKFSAWARCCELLNKMLDRTTRREW